MKILLISYWFVPSSVSNAKRPYYMARTWLEAGHSVDVVTSYAGWDRGQKEILEHAHVFIKRMEDPYDGIYRKLRGRAKSLFQRICMALTWPDEHLLWSLALLFRIRTKPYDRVVLFVRPESLFLFAWLKQVNRTWMVDCQESFLPERVKMRRSPLQHLLLPCFMKLQKTVFKRASTITFTSQSSMDAYVDQNWINPDKCVYFPLFYDDTVPSCSLVNRDRFVLLYTGSFGRIWGRSPEAIFRAMRHFFERNPEVQGRFEFHFYGKWYAEHSPLISKYSLRRVVHLHSPVPYDEYLKLIRSASVLLLVAAKEDNLFVPSKMMDYMATERPILALVPEESETSAILKSAGLAAFITSERNWERCSELLEMLWTEWNNKNEVRDSSACRTLFSWSAYKQRIEALVKVNEHE